MRQHKQFFVMNSFRKVSEQKKTLFSFFCVQRNKVNDEKKPHLSDLLAVFISSPSSQWTVIVCFSIMQMIFVSNFIWSLEGNIFLRIGIESNLNLGEGTSKFNKKRKIHFSTWNNNKVHRDRNRK